MRLHKPDIWVTKDCRVPVAAGWKIMLEGHEDVVCPISLCHNYHLLSPLRAATTSVCDIPQLFGTDHSQVKA
jgi:hypothetical protein